MTDTPGSRIWVARMRMLEEDVAAMITDTKRGYNSDTPQELAHDIVTVVRERVLQEIESVTRSARMTSIP